ncbi:MAG: hypothetical protein GEEBNDBF_02675 [bacterium]|nr:hypothetical protein [bacterium]
MSRTARLQLPEPFPETARVSRAAVESWLQAVISQFAPERIILFGSFAHGTPGPESDLDLLVVLPHDGKHRDCSAQIEAMLPPTFPLDLLSRRPEEESQVLQAADTSDWILSVALKDGVEVYAA